MKTDVYTKVLLTIIAVNLTLISLKQINIVQNVRATPPNSPSLTNYGLVPVNSDGSINAKLVTSDEIDVNITNISTSDKLNVNLEEVDVSITDIDTYDKLKIDLDEVDSYAFSNCIVPVRVKE